MKSENTAFKISERTGVIGGAWKSLVCDIVFVFVFVQCERV